MICWGAMPDRQGAAVGVAAAAGHMLSGRCNAGGADCFLQVLTNSAACCPLQAIAARLAGGTACRRTPCLLQHGRHSARMPDCHVPEAAAELAL